MANTDFQNGFINGFVAGSTNIDVNAINKRDTEANWISNNPVLSNGEQVIVDMNSGDIRIKVGDGVTAFVDLPYIDEDVRAMLDNKAELADDGLIRRDQLPSYVDDVIESYPAEGAEELSVGWFKDEKGNVLEPEKGKIYLNTSTNKQYRWGGNTYILCNPSDVNSVNGKTGLVTLTADDIGADVKGTATQKASEAETNAKNYADSKIATATTELNTKINEIKEEDIFKTKNVSGNSIVVNDSAKAPLQQLKLFGKTTQDGTPTPDAPIPLVSVGDSGSFEVGVFGKNLCDHDIQKNTNYSGLSITPNADKSVTIIGTATAQVTLWCYNILKNLKVGETYIANGGTGVKVVENGVTGYRPIKQPITITENTTEISLYIQVNSGVSVNSTYYPMFCSTNFDYNTYEPCNKQTLTMPYTLPNGNEVDFAKGVLTQRTWYGRVASITQGFLGAQKTHFTGELKYNAKATANNNELGYVLCNIAKNVSANVQYTTNINPATISVTDGGVINLAIEGITTLEDFNSYLAENEVYVVYELKTPVEIPLTETELNAYRHLCTNKGNTTFISEADMDLTYVVDSSEVEYIENRIEKLGVNGKDGKDGNSITSITTDENNNVIVTFSDGTEQTIGQLNIDVQADFLTSDGFGNLRFTDNKFQYYDEATSQWVDTQMTSENVTILNLTPQPMQTFSANFNPDTKNVELYINESADTIIGGQTASTVEEVIIRRKKDTFPIDENDGDLVVITKRRNFGAYKNTPYVDVVEGIEIGDTYCYKAFPINNVGMVSYSASNETQFTAKDYWLFGFVLDQNESDPSSMIRYIEDNESYQSAYMDYTEDKFNYGNWENAWFMKVKPCMLNYDGTVAYYLNPNDYSLKEDGTASDIANASFAGNAMIGIPKTYWKIVDNGDNTANIYFSNKKLDDDFVCWSHIDNNGNEIDYCYMPIYNGYSDGIRLRSLSGKAPAESNTATIENNLAKANNQDDNAIWSTEVYSDRTLINFLLLLIGKSTNARIIFGNGHYSSGNVLSTGTLDSKGLFYGTNTTNNAVKVFGMENWWGNRWHRISGWVSNKGNQLIKMTYGKNDGSTVDGYNLDGTGYISIGTTSGTLSGGYINKMRFTKYGLIPVTAVGSATTYYTDHLKMTSSIGCALTGGYNGVGVGIGLYCCYLGYANSADFSINASISCKPFAPIGEVE